MTIKMLKNAISPQHENRRRIFTSVSWIDSILNRNCFTRFMSLWALSGLASTGIQKLIENDLFLKKGGSVCQIETDGNGLYLGPTSGEGFETVLLGIVFTL